MFTKLPPTTIFGRVIPKNAFDKFTNTKQKKQFTDLVSRISWTHKLSKKTINLKAEEIEEIEIFKIELKSKSEIPQLLNIIDKSISYHIIFWIQYADEAYVSASLKHPNPVNEDASVIDWSFVSEWFKLSDLKYSLKLKESIDFIVKDLCVQISGKPEMIKKSNDDFIDYERNVQQWKNEIKSLKTAISKKGLQFNRKVELNLELKSKEAELAKLIS